MAPITKNGKAAPPEPKLATGNSKGSWMILEDGTQIAVNSPKGQRFKQNIRRQGKARVMFWGPPGSGKTFTALKVAEGLAGQGGRVAMIDTECRAYQYADLFPNVQVFELADHSPESWIQATEEAEEEGFNVLIYDTFTDAWSGNNALLQYKSRMLQENPKLDSFGVWDHVNPAQDRLLNCITRYSSMHTICTVQAKTDWETQRHESGKVKSITPIGIEPAWRSNLLYRFDFVGALNFNSDEQRHTLKWDKEMRFLFQGQSFENPDESIGQTLKAWAEDGVMEPFVFQAFHRDVFAQRTLKNEWSRDQIRELLDVFGLEKYVDIAKRETFLALRQCFSLPVEKGFEQAAWLIDRQPQLAAAEAFNEGEF